MYMPTYESTDTLAAEREVCAIIESGGFECEKLARKQVLDFAIRKEGDKKILWFMEVKSRTCKSDTYETYMIGMKKFMHMLQTIYLLRTRTALVVRFTDRIMKLWISSDVPHHLEMGGRPDRGDPDDFEPVVHLSMDLFEELDLEQGVAS